jgi:predicted RecB family nuclease
MNRLAVLEERYGGSPHLDRFRERMVDLKDLTSSSIVFPLLFYGLKYIAPFLGFSWTGSVKGGGQSVDVFERYLESKDHALLDSIVHYNEEDVRATAFLKDWLAKYATGLTSYEQPYPWVKDGAT